MQIIRNIPIHSKRTSSVEGSTKVLVAGDRLTIGLRILTVAPTFSSGETLQRELIDLLHESLFGNTAQQMSSCRLMLKQESELRRRDEIPVLEATLSIISADRSGLALQSTLLNT